MKSVYIYENLPWLIATIPNAITMMRPMNFVNDNVELI